MNILLVTPSPPNEQPTNAVPLVTFAQIMGLRERHNVTVVTVAGPDPEEWAAVERLRQRGIDVRAVRRTEPTGLRRWQRRWRFVSMWLRGRWPFRTIWFWESEVQQILNEVFVTATPDVIAVEDNAMAIYRYPAAIPRVLTEHEVRQTRALDWQKIRETRSLRLLLGELDWQRWGRYQRSVWNDFERIQVFSPRDAEAIHHIAPALTQRVRINPFGIVVPPAADPAQEDAQSIVFVGGYSHPPNIDAALWLGHEIMPILRQLAPGTRLTLVGSYPPPQVMALACDDIVVTGRVPAVEPYLEEAAVVLAPIRIGGGMRMKVLQAMALGKAVVTTSRGSEGLKFDIEQAPVGIADDAEAIARLTAALLASEEQRRTQGQHARAYVIEHHSATAYAHRLEAVYREVSSRPTPPIQEGQR